METLGEVTGGCKANTCVGQFLFFPSGLVRGALSGLGIDAQVQAEVAGSGLPGAVFQIKTVGAGSGGVR